MKRCLDLVGRIAAATQVFRQLPGDEVLRVFADLRASDVDVLTVGQYLRPSLRHLPVERHVSPEEFDDLKSVAREMGFRHVESGPLVRSSYHAHAQLQ